MKWQQPILRISLAALLASGLIASVYVTMHRQPNAPTMIQCPQLPGTCHFKLPDQRPVSLNFSARPSALHPFLLQVNVANAHTVDARFNMVGMDMGDVHYPLSARTLSNWKTSVILPVCVSGKRNWILQLSVDNQQIGIPFTN